ncbi:MAG: hypothetical protein FWG25_02695 [Promicromonosporaceae bacterium]|nr:hypothetical protein [Promicromonosporaceae bacterium]
MTFALTGIAGISPANAVELLSQEEMLNNGATTLGGTTQSTDPTRYDYAEPDAYDGTTDLTSKNATGMANIPSFTFDFNGLSIKVPAFVLTHKIVGSGLTVTSETASWTGVTNFQLCNYRVDFQNRYGSTIYSTHTTGLHTGCTTFGSGSMSAQNVPYTLKTGAQCARLYVNGTFRGEQCHNVFA